MTSATPVSPGTAEGRAIQLVVESSGHRLDRYVTDRCPGLSRARVQRLIAKGHVTVDGSPAKPSFRLSVGQSVRVHIPPAEPWDLEPQNIPLSVVYEDQDLLVVDKPAGMTVHPAPGHRHSTLANALLAHCADLQGVGGTLRPGIVHRLDKDTSGLLVVAKNDAAFTHLAAQFQQRRVTKVYLALVHGSPSQDEAIVEAPIGRSARDRKRMAVVQGGRSATTRFRVVRRYQRFTLVEAVPTTGRTHQLRVHLASIGHPLAGDATYGRPEPHLGRHFLHAWRLGFPLPSNGKYVEFQAPLPKELAAFLKSLEPY